MGIQDHATTPDDGQTACASWGGMVPAEWGENPPNEWPEIVK